MTYAFLVVSVFLFMLAIKLFGVVPQVREIMAETNTALGVMRSRELGDDEKEERVQKAAIAMMKSAVVVIIRIAATVAVPVVFVAAPVYFGLYTADEIYAAASNWIFIVVSSVVMIALWVFVK